MKRMLGRGLYNKEKKMNLFFVNLPRAYCNGYSDIDEAIYSFSLAVKKLKKEIGEIKFIFYSTQTRNESIPFINEIENNDDSISSFKFYLCGYVYENGEFTIRKDDFCEKKDILFHEVKKQNELYKVIASDNSLPDLEKAKIGMIYKYPFVDTIIMMSGFYDLNENGFYYSSKKGIRGIIECIDNLTETKHNENRTEKGRMLNLGLDGYKWSENE